MTCMYCAHTMYVACTCYACVMHVLGEWNTHAMHVLCACYAYAMHVLYRAATGSYAHRVRLPRVTARGGAARRASPGCHKQLGAAHAVATRHGAWWAGPRASPGCHEQLCASYAAASRHGARWGRGRCACHKREGAVAVDMNAGEPELHLV